MGVCIGSTTRDLQNGYLLWLVSDYYKIYNYFDYTSKKYKLQSVVSKMHFFERFLQKNLRMSKKSSTFAPSFQREWNCKQNLVKLKVGATLINSAKLYEYI